MSALLPIYPPRTLAPAPELNGSLSPAEIAFAPEALARDSHEEAARRSALAIHAKAVDRAVHAREALREIACGHDPRSVKSCGDLAKAVDAHARAQCWLREAAQAVCDICEFEDNGRAAGVVWETPLYTTPEPEAA